MKEKFKCNDMIKIKPKINQIPLYNNISYRVLHILNFSHITISNDPIFHLNLTFTHLKPLGIIGIIGEDAAHWVRFRCHILVLQVISRYPQFNFRHQFVLLLPYTARGSHLIAAKNTERREIVLTKKRKLIRIYH